MYTCIHTYIFITYIHIYIYSRDMPHSHVRPGSFIFGMSHPYVWHNWFICATLLFYACLPLRCYIWNPHAATSSWITATQHTTTSVWITATRCNICINYCNMQQYCHERLQHFHELLQHNTLQHLHEFLQHIAMSAWILATRSNIVTNDCNTPQHQHELLHHAATSSWMTATHRNIFSPTHQPSAVADLAWHVTYEVAVCCNVLQCIAVCVAACEEAVTYDNAMPHR